MSLTAFTLVAAPGGSTLTVDGQDVTDRFATAVVEVGGRETIPQLTITQHVGQGEISGEGVVTVVRPPDGDDVAAAVVEFLESIDPTSLGPLVEARFTSMASSPIALTLQTLIDLAREVAGG